MDQKEITTCLNSILRCKQVVHGWSKAERSTLVADIKELWNRDPQAIAHYLRNGSQLAAVELDAFYSNVWPDSPVFVFGSNLAGRHGAGAAHHAFLKHGAVMGQAEGRQGNSYAIPTKGKTLNVLPLPQIAEGVARFKQYAASRPRDCFLVTRIGCGLAGYKGEQIAPMFRDAPINCELPDWS